MSMVGRSGPGSKTDRSRGVRGFSIRGSGGERGVAATLLRRSVPQLVVFVVLVAIVPATEGQGSETYEFELTAPEPEGLAPVDESFQRELTFTLRCLTPVPPAVPPTFNVSARTGHSAATVTADPTGFAFDVDPVTCANNEPQTRNLSVTITIDMQVPAATAIPIYVNVTSDDGRQAVTEWAERPAPVLVASMRFEEDRFKAGPNSRIMLPLFVTNEGNAIIRVSLYPESGTSPHLNFALPQVTTLELDPGTMWIAIDVQTPFENGYLERSDVLSVHGLAQWVGDEEVKLDLGVHNATIETVGTYLPGPSAAFVGVTLVGVLAFAARRRPPT